MGVVGGGGGFCGFIRGRFLCCWLVFALCGILCVAFGLVFSVVSSGRWAVLFFWTRSVGRGTVVGGLFSGDWRLRLSHWYDQGLFLVELA